MLIQSVISRYDFLVYQVNQWNSPLSKTYGYKIKTIHSFVQFHVALQFQYHIQIEWILKRQSLADYDLRLTSSRFIALKLHRTTIN